MKNQQAVDAVVEIVKTRVSLMNMYLGNVDAYEKATWDRLSNQLDGMLIVLKNINDEERFYCINYFDDRIEFGYYDEFHNWIVIQNSCR